MDAAFSACRVVVSAKTHAARRAGAQFAEVGDAAASHIARAGGWNVSVMESAYLTNIPLEVSRVHAGFDKGGGGFFLRRDVAVPEELLEKVFPWAQKWLSAVEEGTLDGHHVEKNIAARGFLCLLLRLRAVVVQDAVALRRQHPHWYLWKHTIFSSAEFLAYEKQLNVTLDAPDTSTRDRLQNALPLIAERMDAVVGSLQQHVDLRVQALQSTVETLVTNFAATQHLYFQQVQLQQQALLELQKSASRAALSILAASSASPSTAPVDSTAPLLQPPEASRALALLSGPSANARERGGDSEEVPAGFEQDRTISSCVDLWREYKEGIGGAPSVEDMDKKWNARWRRLDKDRVHYKRRMIIINRIKAVIASEKVSAERAVFLVERARLALSTPRSLDKLSKMLRDETFEVALS
ncbi:unnamed protein product [Tilletia laevis]|uniref:Transcription activator GCR1-like domain-containing protein n=1 Tax=Tilletia laevis TaxID=157183 RepID=A0A9N8M2E5_9BASI|nr:hypothetical protein CF336_g6987 [Tilletia laevis]CAD6897721.1 unnamed protein product [Tilletia laevis]CAD6952873.1 unnamed protein product [Tilletia laevis]